MDQEISAPGLKKWQGGHVKIGKQWILGRLMLDSDTPGVITDYHSILQPKNQVICTVYADSICYLTQYLDFSGLLFHVSGENSFKRLRTELFTN